MSEPVEQSPDLLGVLRSGPVGVSSPDDVAQHRAEMLPWLEAQVAELPARRLEHKRSQRLRWMAASGLAAAAAVALAVFVGKGIVTETEGTVATVPRADEPGQSFLTLSSGQLASGTLDLLSGSRIGTTSRVATPKAGAATLTGKGGLTITLAESTDLSLGSAEERKASRQSLSSELELHTGQATFSVPSLPAGETFVVVTKDARVTVIGTKFSVARLGETTCVRVTEGKVAVARDTGSEMLTAGQSSGCDLLSSAGKSPSAKSKGTVGVAPSTTLAEENALVTRALSAERRGEAEAARRAYSELLSKYPHSAFARDAREGLGRLAPDSAAATPQ